MLRERRFRIDVRDYYGRARTQSPAARRIICNSNQLEMLNKVHFEAPLHDDFQGPQLMVQPLDVPHIGPMERYEFVQQYAQPTPSIIGIERALRSWAAGVRRAIHDCESSRSFNLDKAGLAFFSAARRVCTTTCMRSGFPHFGHWGIVRAVNRTSLLAPQALHAKRHEMVSIEIIWSGRNYARPQEGRCFSYHFNAACGMSLA